MGTDISTQRREDAEGARMPKMDGGSKDVIAERVEALKRLAPESFVDGKIDFDALRAAFGDAVDSSREHYRFTWNGKEEARAFAFAPTMGTLRPCREESKDWDSTRNLYIEGDNLEVLKMLQGPYHRSVKMIYIDPPYNTGHDFVYPDDFSDSIANYKERTGQTDGEGHATRSNPETSGRFHTDWLNMMFPRLLLARNLLRDDGVIFISIDDNEVANLRKLCDEVFGENNFIGMLPRRTKSGGGSASDKFAIEHDYIIVFAKDAERLPPFFIPFDAEYLKRYAEQDGIGRFFWDTMERSSTKTRPYTITAPDGTILTGKWFRSEERFYEDLNNGEVRFLKKTDGTWSVQFKQRLADGRKLRSLLWENEFKSLETDLDELGMGGMFDYPKTVYLLHHLFQLTKPNDLILDFFSGSATTAHAVMQLNAEDGGNRRFIMVQLPEKCKEESEAAKAGYANICEIGKERIRRAGEKVLEEFSSAESAEVAEKEKQADLFAPNGIHDSDATERVPPDVGFRVFKLDTSNLIPWNPDPENLEKSLYAVVENAVEGRTADDLFFEILLKSNLPLDAEVVKEPCGENAILVATGEAHGDAPPQVLMACLDKTIPQAVAEEMARLRGKYAGVGAARVVFRDGGLTDEVKANATMILKEAGVESVASV